MKQVLQITQWTFVMLLLMGSANLQAQKHKPHLPHALPDSAQVEKMVAHISGELQLSDAQKEAISKSFHQHFKKVKTVRENYTEVHQQERQQMEKLKKSLDEEILSVLKPEQQAQFKELQKNRRPQRPDKHPSKDQKKHTEGIH